MNLIRREPGRLLAERVILVLELAATQDACDSTCSEWATTTLRPRRLAW
jgi:hypothetical protein